MQQGKNELIIIGGGAAGLAAAVLCARNGLNVILLEQNDRVGKKIFVSGNGKCNIGNKTIIPSRFHSQNSAFIEQVLKGYDAKVIETFFRSIGLELVEGKEDKLFPMSMQAASVVELLEFAAQEAGVKIACNCVVKRVDSIDNHFTLETSQGIYTTHRLVLTSGSVAAPKLGGSSAGYAFATRMGHTLVPRYPSLVQLVSEEPWLKQCAGVKLPGTATLFANGMQVTQREGDLLFTPYGISGLAILDLSREVSLHLAQFDYCELSLDLMPRFTKEQLTNLLLGRIDTKSHKPLSLWLQGVLHKKLVPHIIEVSKVKAKTESELNRKEIGKLVYALKHLKMSISDTKGFEHAEVATGGVDTSEVAPETMMSKVVKNLYFAGEILDVDGDRGGFNFHFAWVSAMRAASHISSQI